MAKFQEVGRHWARMCKAFRTLPNGCSGCPLVDEHCYHESPFALDFDRIEYAVMQWAEKNPEPVYPSIAKYLEQFGIMIRRDGSLQADFFRANEPMSSDIAEKLGIKPCNNLAVKTSDRIDDEC